MLFLSIPAYMSPPRGNGENWVDVDMATRLGPHPSSFWFTAGVCLGTFVWMVRDFGWRIMPWFTLFAVIVLGLGYACEPLLWDSRKVEVDHTHAFDDLSSPFYKNRDTTPEAMACRTAQTRKPVWPTEQLSLTCLFSLLGFGLLLRIVDRSGKLEHWLVQAHRKKAARLGSKIIWYHPWRCSYRGTHRV